MEISNLTKPQVDDIIDRTIKKSFGDFCQHIAGKQSITQAQFDLLHSFRDWIITDLNKENSYAST